MYEEECLLAFETHLGNQVSFHTFAGSDVVENFLVKVVNMSRIKIGRNFGKKEFDKIGKKLLQQFFEQAVVVNGQWSYD